MTNVKTTIREKILSRILVDENGCWVWQGRIVSNIPYLTINKKSMSAKRIVFEEWVGLIPDSSIHVRLSCNNPVCMCPDHLILEEVGAAYRGITHCKHGHSLHDAHIKKGGVGRDCATCRTLRNERRRNGIGK